jgi:glutaminyl-peptide cyclotransferase
MTRCEGEEKMPTRTAKHQRDRSKPGRKGFSKNWLIIAAAVVALIGVGMYLSFRSGSSEGAGKPVSNQSSASSDSQSARKISYEVVDTYPHDPEAFLQGLVWHDGGFYESTGLNGESTLRRVEFPSGRVLKKISLSPDLFGEGLALVDDHLVQITWQTHRGFVYDRETFRLIREFTYDSEGWGITYDGKNLIMSDGTSTLTYLDPQTYQPVKKLNVTMNGRPVFKLNELEFIEGEIWSNVWQTDMILRIDPATGTVNSYLDMRGALAREFRTGREDVLNGIAYDAERKRIFISGKKWSRIIEIKLK